MKGSLWMSLLLATVGGISSSSDFLRSTLDKIQQERLDTMMIDSTQPENNTDYNGEIVFETDENSLGSHDLDNFEFTYNNQLDSEEQHAETSGQSQKIVQHGSQSGSTQEDDGEVQGYYYYFYPLNHYVQNLPNRPVMHSMNESDMMAMVMDTVMKNSMMTKSENKVTPLFKAITWFIGTAMIFVISILLLPKFRVKKAKNVLQERNVKFQFSEDVPRVISSIFMLPTTFHIKHR